MGRPAKSNLQKKLTGTLQPCRAKKSKFTVEGFLQEKPPTGLDKTAKAAWRMAVQFAPPGMLTALDHGVLERWCRNYSWFRQLSKQLDTEGFTVMDEKGNVFKNPIADLVLKVQGVMLNLEKELGFSPAARARVRVPEQKQTSNKFLLDDD